MGILDDAASPLTCANCKWWAEHSLSGYGYCQRHAPVKLADNVSCHWPTTSQSQYCGDHEPAAR